ncbi:MAG: hypothetical protein ABSH01_15375 [Terriglobia bacterium]
MDPKTPVAHTQKAVYAPPVKANANLEVGAIPVFHSGKRLFLMEWTANGKRYVNHYLQGMPPFSLAQYKSWLSKIAALQNDFDAASVGK